MKKILKDEVRMTSCRLTVETLGHLAAMAVRERRSQSEVVESALRLYFGQSQIVESMLRSYFDKMELK